METLPLKKATVKGETLYHICLSHDSQISICMCFLIATWQTLSKVNFMVVKSESVMTENTSTQMLYSQIPFHNSEILNDLSFSFFRILRQGKALIRVNSSRNT